MLSNLNGLGLTYNIQIRASYLASYQLYSLAVIPFRIFLTRVRLLRFRKD